MCPWPHKIWIENPRRQRYSSGVNGDGCGSCRKYHFCEWIYNREDGIGLTPWGSGGEVGSSVIKGHVVIGYWRGKGWGRLQAAELGPWIGHALSRSSDTALAFPARILFSVCTENKISAKLLWERKVRIHELGTELGETLQS